MAGMYWTRPKNWSHMYENPLAPSYPEVELTPGANTGGNVPPCIRINCPERYVYANEYVVTTCIRDRGNWTANWSWIRGSKGSFVQVGVVFWHCSNAPLACRIARLLPSIQRQASASAPGRAPSRIATPCTSEKTYLRELHRNCTKWSALRVTNPILNGRT